MGDPKKELLWFEFEPDDPARPGETRLRAYTPRNEARYIDKVVTAVGFGIYIGGYHVYCEGSEVPVFVPESMVDFGLGSVTEASGELFPSAEAARAAVAASASKPAVAYFTGGGGAVVAPTLMCPATTPRLIATMLEARRELGKAVSDELTVLAISLVGGMILRAVVMRVVGAKGSGKLPPQNANPVKIRAKNDKINVGGALEKGSEQYTNLNPVNPNSGGASRGIPNHVQAPFEEIGEIFQPGTVNEIISNRLRYVDVKDWSAAARGAFKVLRPGGRIGSGHPASGMNVWAEEREVAALIKAFKDAGFKDVRNVGSGSGPGVVIQALKP